MNEQEQILKLAAEIANSDLQELVEGHRRRLLILDSQIEALRRLEQIYRERLAEVDALLTRLEAVARINERFWSIADPQPKTKEWNRRHGITVNFTKRG